MLVKKEEECLVDDGNDDYIVRGGEVWAGEYKIVFKNKKFLGY